jgi:hypothetical protein
MEDLTCKKPEKTLIPASKGYLSQRVSLKENIENEINEKEISYPKNFEIAPYQKPLYQY